MQLNKKRRAAGGAACLAALLAVALALWNYGVRAGESEWSQVAKTASNEARLGAADFAGRLAAAQGVLRGAAAAWPEAGEVGALLAQIEATGGFESVGLIAADGNGAGGWTPSAGEADDWLARALGGEAGFAAGADGALTVYQPIPGGGALCGLLDVGKISEGAALIVRTGGENVAAFLCSERDILAAGDAWSGIESARFLEGSAQALAAGEPAFARIASPDGDCAVASAPTGIDDWNYILLRRASALAGDSQSGRREVYHLVIELLAIGAAALIALVLSEHRARREARQAQDKLETLIRTMPGGVTRLSMPACRLEYASEGFERIVGYTYAEMLERFDGDMWALVHPDDAPGVRAALQEYRDLDEPFFAEYRLIHKDGRAVDVFDRSARGVGADDKDCFYSVYLDCSDQKSAEHELRLRDEWLGAILRCAQVRAFEYDAETDAVRGADGARIEGVSQDGLDAFWEYLAQGAQTGSREDRKALLEALGRVRKGAGYAECVLKSALPDGGEGYCKVVLSATGDRAVGVAFDATPQVTRELAQDDGGLQDALTGLLSRRTAEQAVDEYLEFCEPYDLCGFMAIAVEGYAAEGEGRATPEAAAILRRAFRDTDVIAHLQGGAFCVFMKSVQSVELVESRAEHVCERLHALSQILPGLRAYIGLSFAPVDGRSFAVLHARALEGLEAARAQGPSGFALCE